jgi:MSHA biogenesis protein MshL
MAAGVLSGCAATSDKLAPIVSARTEAAVMTALPDAAPVSVITEHAGEYLAVKAVPHGARGDVSLRSAGAPFGPLVAELAKRHGYSIVFADSVEATRKVTADFTQQSLDSVVRGTARLAGYAVVLDKARRVYTVAEQATYVFKLPPSLFQQVGASYSAGGGGAIGGGGGGGSSSGASGPSSGGTQSASFSVTGRSSPNSAQIQSMIRDQAGAGAEVSVSDIGLVAVRANALGLERAQRFITQLARDALTQVEVEAAVVEVSLQDDFELGIDWSGVLGLGASSVLSQGGVLKLAMSGAAAVTNPNFSGSITSASVNSVINSLSKFTDVKVVSRPHVVSMNNIPSTFFAGNNLPYLGSTSTSSTTTATTATGEVSFAANGVTFSVVPSVMSDKLVHLTLLPSLSKVNGFSQFNVNGTILSAPDQSSRNAYMQVLAEAGKTLIIGGMKSAQDNSASSRGLGVLPVGQKDQGNATELVILLRTRIIPAPVIDPLVSESI